MADMRKTGGPDRPGKLPETLLNDALAAARADAMRPVSAALLARVLADADRLAPQPAPRAAPSRQGWLTGLVAALGGWPALGGLATAGLAGFWLGVAPPATVQDLGLWSADQTGAALLLPDDYMSDLAEG